MDVKIEPSWKRELSAEFDALYFQKLAAALHDEYRRGPCYPPGGQIFNAFNLTPFDQVKVVIIGQDPYHEPGQAMGLSFSVASGVPMPPSLVNIFKEIRDDLGAPLPPNGDLTRWARQGVLLLNATLTVRAHEANSHARLGWSIFTDAAIRALAREREHIVYMLWGAYARSKRGFVDPSRNLILEAAHPSPMSANRGGWFGNKHFSQCNAYLVSHGEKPIEW